MSDEDEEICDECECSINCLKDGIYIVTKGEEEKVWCPSCFDDLWKDADKDGWGGDDIEEMLENKKKKKINKKKKKNK